MPSRLALCPMNAISKYMSKIGKRGGLKRALHPNKSELAKRAADVRWTAQRLSKQNECQSCQTAENKVN